MYRIHLQSFAYKYRIDVQPQIAVPVDALKQGLRFILFNLNRKYLKVRKFGHLPPEQKFWALAFKEGDGVSKGIHYHILLHCPVERIDPLSDIHMQWSKLRLHKHRDGQSLTVFKLDEGTSERLVKCPKETEEIAF